MNRWVLPINIKKCDIVSLLRTTDTLVWKAKKKFAKDDIVYLYLASPIQEIRYRCVCINENVSSEILENYAYAKEREVNRYAMFKVEKVYAEGLMPWEELHKNGLGQVLLPSKIYAQLDTYITSKE